MVYRLVMTMHSDSDEFEVDGLYSTMEKAEEAAAEFLKDVGEEKAKLYTKNVYSVALDRSLI